MLAHKLNVARDICDLPVLVRAKRCHLWHYATVIDCAGPVVGYPGCADWPQRESEAVLACTAERVEIRGIWVDGKATCKVCIDIEKQT